MKRTPVKSSRVISIGWEANTLEVEFTGGSVYQYKPVPKSTHDNLLSSHHVGVDIQKVIKDQGIVCTKM